jgi:TrmH family RNA methyltransferase
VQRLRRLLSSRRARWEERCFVVEGPKLVSEALASGATVDAVFIDRNARRDPFRSLGESATRAGAKVLELQPGVLARACDTVTSQPIAAIVGMTDVSVAEVTSGSGLLLVSAGLQDPGNAGTILRSGAASEAGGAVFSSGSVDVYNPKAVRASAGSIFKLPIAVGGPAEDVLEQIGRSGMRRLLTVPRGGEDYSTVDLTKPTAVVFGNEGSGVPDLLMEQVDGRISIPMDRGSESLNVAMAATVICFEAARQVRLGRHRGPSAGSDPSPLP